MSHKFAPFRNSEFSVSDDLQKFDLKDQVFVWADFSTRRTTCPVSHRSRNVKLPYFAFTHRSQSLNILINLYTRGGGYNTKFLFGVLGSSHNFRVLGVVKVKSAKKFRKISKQEAKKPPPPRFFPFLRNFTTR